MLSINSRGQGQQRDCFENLGAEAWLRVLMYLRAACSGMLHSRQY